jgi:hypothetical protein
MLITRDVTKKSEDRTNLALVSKFRSKLNDLNLIKDITLRQLLIMQETASDMQEKVSELHDDLTDDLNDTKDDLSARGVSGKDDVIDTIQTLVDEAEDELDDIGKGIDVTINCLNVCQTCNHGCVASCNNVQTCTTGETSCYPACNASCNTNDGYCATIVDRCSACYGAMQEACLSCYGEGQQILQCIQTGNTPACTDENQGTGTVTKTCEACYPSEVTTTTCTPTTNGKCSSCDTSQTTTCKSTVDSEDLCDTVNYGTLCDNYNTSGDCISDNSTGNCSFENGAGTCDAGNIVAMEHACRMVWHPQSDCYSTACYCHLRLCHFDVDLGGRLFMGYVCGSHRLDATLLYRQWYLADGQ